MPSRTISVKGNLGLSDGVQLLGQNNSGNGDEENNTVSRIVLESGCTFAVKGLNNQLSNLNSTAAKKTKAILAIISVHPEASLEVVQCVFGTPEDIANDWAFLVVGI